MLKSYTLSICFLLLFLVGCNNQELVDLIGPIETTAPICAQNTQMDANVIIGDLDWLPHDQITDISQTTNAKSVGHLKIPKVYASCTAFLINKNTIMTNNHCISTDAQAKGATFKPIKDNDTRDTFLCEKVLVSNYLLDFTLVQCEGNPGDKYGFIPLSSRKIQATEAVYVIQENCNYIDDPRCIIDKYIAYGEVTKIATNSIAHDADTLPGSSGSPIFAEDTDELIGLHNAGKDQSSQGPASNFGVPIQKIRDYLKLNYAAIPIYEFANQPVPSPLPTPVPKVDECTIN